MPSVNLAGLTFGEAADVWLRTREGHLSPRTYIDYKNYIKTLSRAFGEMKLPEITADQVRAYQQMRRMRVGSGIINKELGVLMMMRERIGMPIVDYQRLRMPKDWETPGRALTPSEEATLERVFKAAATHSLWDVAALCSLLSMKTGMGPGEILSLKLKDIGLGEPVAVEVPRRGAKRVRRERVVVCLDLAAWAVKKLVDRAVEKCGATDPDHFLVPLRRRDHSYDPTQPARGYREGMRQLLATAGIWIRRYDLRHHAVSRALSDPRVSLSAATLHFGHISSVMRRRYYHGDLETLKVVAAAIQRKPIQPVRDIREQLKKYHK